MNIDIETIRSWFPTLQKTNLVYLDNAASTLKPIQVIEAVKEKMMYQYANVHRGVYPLAAKATEDYEHAHETVASFLKAKPEEIVFTSGSTGSLQLAARLLEHNNYITEKTTIILPLDLHHSALLPFYKAGRRNKSRIILLDIDEKGVPKWDTLEELLVENPSSIIVAGHVSNVTGYEALIARIGKLAAKHGACLIVDGAQSVPHLPINVEELGACMLAFSGHKMLAPTGIGVLWIKKELAETLEPAYGGGGAVGDVKAENNMIQIEWLEPPWRFEHGTPPIIEAAGLEAAVKLLDSLGMENIANQEYTLVKHLYELLTESIPGIDILGPTPEERRGLVSFTVEGVHPDFIGIELGLRNIAVRTGMHCAGPLHHSLGKKNGSIRASVYLYNTLEDVEKLVETLKTILS